MADKVQPIQLSLQDASALVYIVNSPGFPALQTLMEKRAEAASLAMLRVKPDDPERSKKIDALQAIAYATVEAFKALKMDIAYNVMVAGAPQEPSLQEEAIEA